MGARVGSAEGPLWDPVAVPAATVIVLRDQPQGPEVLMLRRDTNLSFAGGMWVFPGGRIDDTDRDGDTHAVDDPDDALERAARRAAVREAAEEAGIALDETQLVRWSHWTPPPRAGNRFSTAFFCVGVDGASATVTVDGGEIREHRWMRPREVIDRRAAGEISLAPPTFITLTQLEVHPTVADALEWARSSPVEHFATRITVDGDVWIARYHGDVAYEDDDGSGAGGNRTDVHRPGPRHRLVMGPTWTYERSGRGVD